MKARVVVALFPLVAGCGGYIGHGPAPNMMVARPLAVQIAVLGDEQKLVESSLEWVLKGSGLVNRVFTGGEGHILLTSKVTKEVAILAGTDCTVSVDLKAISTGGQEVMHERREFRREHLDSNVPTELEKLVTESVVWAVEKGVAQLQSPSSAAVEAAPAPAAAPATAAAEPEPAATPTVTADQDAIVVKKKKHRRP
jgi:hypothetical protein